MPGLVNAKVSNWTPTQLPDLAGRTYLITGGNSGIGLEAARVLLGHGAAVIIAARNPEKAAGAVTELSRTASADVSSVELDLADTASIRAAADDIRARQIVIDGLINNAGIMQTPKSLTKDGFETQFGTNHLGHFLWTALLIDLINKKSGRVVTVSSIAHKYGRMSFDDLMLSRGYTPTRAYCQSKLANLIHAFELHRRLTKAGSNVASIACHPGYSNTNLQSTGPGALLSVFYKPLNALVAQSAEKGAIPTVLAAAGDEARSGCYFGPTGFRDLNGPVGDASSTRAARDEAAGEALWAASEQLLDISFEI